MRKILLEDVLDGENSLADERQGGSQGDTNLANITNPYLSEKWIVKEMFRAYTRSEASNLLYKEAILWVSIVGFFQPF